MKEEFLNSLQNILNQEDFSRYLKSFNEEPKKSFRLNKRKCEMVNDDTASHNAIDYIVNKYFATKNQIIDTAFHIQNEIKLGNEWFHKSGLVYVQEPSSMMAVYGLKQVANFNGARVLDMCASPGGKTSQLSEMVGDNGFVLSNEINNKRANILRSNVERLGLANVAISSCESGIIKNNLSGQFDAVLVDAPCSGEGMFRKDVNAQTEWSLGEVERNHLLQLKILNDGASCVKSGGFLVYSTCTFNTHENEEVVYEFLKNNKNFKIIKCCEEVNKISQNGIALNGLDDLKYARRFYPFDNFGEGQFVCIMQNFSDEQTAVSSFKFQNNKKEFKMINDFIAKNFNLTNSNISQLGNIYFMHNNNFPELKHIPLLTCGVAVCEIEKNIIKPHHNLFMAYGEQCVNRLNLSSESEWVSKFFKGEQIEGDVKDGFCAVCIEGFCVGFGKAKNGIINNHYPKGLRN